MRALPLPSGRLCRLDPRGLRRLALTIGAAALPLLANAAAASTARPDPAAPPAAAERTAHAGAAAEPLTVAAQSLALERAAAAVVGLQVVAVDDASTAATLGRARQGSGVVIGADGLVLTIGYLLLEAEQVELVTDDGGRIPARVVGVDVASGFGLVQALAPLKLAPVPLGEADSALLEQPLLMVSGGAGGAIGSALLMSRRAFSAYWEYHLDSALWTAPPRADHSGAALFNLRGELLGIGSLVVADSRGADGAGGQQPGNLFVPVDALKPVLRELIETGRTRASQRAWLGVNCVERDGDVRVVRVTGDSPADVAGLQRGDRILRIDGAPVSTLEQLWKRLWAGESPERAVQLEIERDGQPLALTVQSVEREKTLRRAQGV